MFITKRTHTHTHSHTLAHAHTCVHTHTRACTHIHTGTHTHTYTYTQVHTVAQLADLEVGDADDNPSVMRLVQSVADDVSTESAGAVTEDAGSVGERLREWVTSARSSEVGLCAGECGGV